MKTKADFLKLVDGKFFNHLNSKSLIPFNEKSQRIAYLDNLYERLHSNILNYKPKPPRKYLSFPKSKYVIRMLPTFELDDYCIYYFCVKVLEEFIAENRVKGTFGGFRLGGKLRDRENQEFEPAFEDSINENSFNTFAWKVEYGEYQSKLYEVARKMGSDFQFAVSFDIANFYDCINLDRLLQKINRKVPAERFEDEIHLLFRFLRLWHIKFDSKKNIGIPQDEVAECSRILANFFLQDYDQFVFNECKKRDAVYLRYSDDQIIFAKSQEDAEEILYQASLKLFEEGLNINTGKLKEFRNFQEFDDCYGFSIFESLKFDTQDINRAFDMFIAKKNVSQHFRESSILKRMLHSKIDLYKLQNQKRIKLLSFLWDENFLLFATEHYMKQVYRMLKDDSEKKEYLETLENLYKKTKFETFKINFETFKRNLEL